MIIKLLFRPRVCLSVLSLCVSGWKTRLETAKYGWHSLTRCRFVFSPFFFVWWVLKFSFETHSHMFSTQECSKHELPVPKQPIAEGIAIDSAENNPNIWKWSGKLDDLTDRWVEEWGWRGDRCLLFLSVLSYLCSIAFRLVYAKSSDTEFMNAFIHCIPMTTKYGLLAVDCNCSWWPALQCRLVLDHAGWTGAEASAARVVAGMQRSRSRSWCLCPHYSSVRCVCVSFVFEQINALLSNEQVYVICSRIANVARTWIKMHYEEDFGSGSATTTSSLTVR